MITKKEYCRFIILDFKRSHKFPPDIDDKELIKYIYTDSKLAVALDFLGIINLENFPDEHNYISHRGGLLLVHPYKTSNNTLDIATLSVREMIDLLPDERDDHSYSDINILNDHLPVCND